MSGNSLSSAGVGDIETGPSGGKGTLEYLNLGTADGITAYGVSVTGPSMTGTMDGEVTINVGLILLRPDGQYNALPSEHNHLPNKVNTGVFGPFDTRDHAGMHGRMASWEAYRDVLTELFNRYPDAVVRTQMATYKGRAGFEETYPRTEYLNWGSMAAPVTMPQLTV